MDVISLSGSISLDISAYSAALQQAQNMAAQTAGNIQTILNGIENNTTISASNVSGAVGNASESIRTSIDGASRTVRDSMGGASNSAESFGDRVRNMSSDVAGSAANVVSSLKGIASAVSAAFAIDKIVDFTKQAVSAFGEYEQMVGGIQTIYKNAANDLITTAQNSYRTAQTSASSYMQQATKFSAQLMQNIAKEEKQRNMMSEEEFAASLDAKLQAYKDSLDEQYEIAEKNYDNSYNALQKSLDDEIDAFQTATDKKIAAINKEYVERIKLIDEEKYKRIKAIDDQIEAINDQADAEKYATSQSEYMAKKAELEETARNAKKRKFREQAAKDLEKLNADWEQKEADRSRKQQIESLKDQKEAIKESYDNQKEQLKAEQDEKVSAVKESEKAQLKVMKEARAEQLKAVKESNEQQLKELKKRYDEEKLLAKKSSEEQLQAYMDEYNSIPEYTEETYRKAREVSDRIIKDMADNAMKLGTPLYMIQNAYRGFLMDNYRMLDNLYLGYGQTKSEAQRLVKDASQLTDIQEELGITVDESSTSFLNMANAISVIQKKLGFTGTAEYEAINTVQGSISMTKAALDNLLAGFGDKNADLKKLTQDFIDSFVGYTDEAGDHVKGMLDNVVPVASNAIKSIATALPELGKAIVDTLSTEFPNVAGIFDKLKGLFKNISDFIGQVIGTVSEKIGPVLQKLIPIIEKIVNILSDFIARIANSKLIMNSFADILGAVAKVAETLIAALGGILDYFKQNESILSGLIGSFIALKVAIEAYNIVMGIAQTAVAAWNMITKTATAVQTGLNAAMAANPIGLVIVAIGALVAAITLLWNNCEEFRNAIIYMYNEWQHGIELIGEWFFNVGQDIKAFWEGIPKFFENVWHGIQDAFSSVGEWFKDTFSKAWEGIKNVFSTTGQMFGNIGKSILNGLSSVINGIIWGINQVIKMPLDGLNAILRLIHDIDIFGLKPFSWIGQIPVPQIPSIPMLAEGGVLKRGQMALLEGQGDEAVIPLSQNTEWIDMVANRLKNSGEPQQVYYSVNINVDRMNANSEDDIEALADRLMEIMAEKGARKGMGFR